MTTASDFEPVAREWGPMIARIAASYEADPALAADLVQDILLALWKALPSFRGDSSMRTFVARIATNRAVTHIARHMKLPRAVELDDEIPSAAASPEALAIVGDQRSKLLAAVRELPLVLRQPAMLTMEGLDPAEIADMLGVTPNTISIRLTRAKDRLRALLGEKT